MSPGLLPPCTKMFGTSIVVLLIFVGFTSTSHKPVLVVASKINEQPVEQLQVGARDDIKVKQGCVITTKHCQNSQQFSRTQFHDVIGEAELEALNAASYCLRRAEDFHYWCGNGRENQNATVAATYLKTGETQIYHPTACDTGWSLYHKNCYKHVWENKSWWEAEAWCNLHGGNLCSVHGAAENDFVYTLTWGLRSWIGYHDKDKDEEYKWTDNTKTDYENTPKNCTGRESDPDCTREEAAKKWYHASAEQVSTFVCKKPANYGLHLLRNGTSLSLLPLLDWEAFKSLPYIAHLRDESSELDDPPLDIAPTRNKDIINDGRTLKRCATCD